MYLYTINNDYTRYNICSSWFLDIVISTCLFKKWAVLLKSPAATYSRFYTSKAGEYLINDSLTESGSILLDIPNGQNETGDGCPFHSKYSKALFNCWPAQGVARDSVSSTHSFKTKPNQKRESIKMRNNGITE